MQVRVQPWFLGNYRGVDVPDSITRRAHRLSRRRQQAKARSAFVFRVGGRKQLAYVPKTRGAEQGVDHCVREHVRIRMTLQSHGVTDRHSAEDEIAAGFQPVNVIADADLQLAAALAAALAAVLAAASCSLIRASTTPRSSRVVSLMLACSPSTTVTA